MSEFTIWCAFHGGAEITVCGCPPIDSPGAHAYRGLAPFPWQEAS